MSVRQRKERDPATGKLYEVWIVDVQYRHPNGSIQRIKRKSPVQTKRGAEQYERQIRQEIMAGTFGRKEEHKPTLAEFAEEFLSIYAASHNKPSEVEAKKSVLRAWLVPRFGKRQIDDVHLRDVEVLKAGMLKRGLSAKRVNNTLTVLNRMLKWAVETGRMESSPQIKFLPVPPQEFDFLDYAEYARLLAAAAEEPLVQTAILVAGDAGLRAGEVRALKWTRIDFVAKRLTVAETFWRRRLGSPKGGRIGWIPMTEALTQALKSSRHLRGEFVFCNDKGEPWSRDWADAALRRQCRRAGLREISWHVLRHSFCSHLAMRGASPKATMELARHTSLGVTQRYMHMSPDARREAVELLDTRPGHGPESTAEEKKVVTTGG